MWKGQMGSDTESLKWHAKLTACTADNGESTRLGFFFSSKRGDCMISDGFYTT